MTDEYIKDKLGNPVYEDEIGEAPSYEPIQNEFSLKESFLNFDDRNAVGYRLKQIRDSSGRLQKVAKYNKYKEYITKTLKSGNIKQGSIEAEWFFHRLKFIRFMIRKDEQEKGSYEDFIDDLVDDMNAVLGGSLSLDHVGIDSVLVSREQRTLNDNRSEEAKRSVFSNMWGDKRRQEYY